MSYEETMVCDGCSGVLSGGSRRQMVLDLKAMGGESFTVDDRPRHLCNECVGRKAFFDGLPVPGVSVAKP